MAYTGEDFEPALGFVRRRGGRSVFIPLIPSNLRIVGNRRHYYGSRLFPLRSSGWGLDTEEINLKLIEVRTHGGDRFDFSIEFEREILLSPFEIVNGIEIAAGEYRQVEFELEWASSKRPFSWKWKLNTETTTQGTR